MSRNRKTINLGNGFVSREDGVSADDALTHNLRRSIDIYEAEIAKERSVPPYGYAVDVDGKLVPNEAEQLVISAVADFKAAGLSTQQIAEELTNAGIAPRARSTT